MGGVDKHRRCLIGRMHNKACLSLEQMARPNRDVTDAGHARGPSRYGVCSHSHPPCKMKHSDFRTNVSTRINDLVAQEPKDLGGSS